MILTKNKNNKKKKSRNVLTKRDPKGGSGGSRVSSDGSGKTRRRHGKNRRLGFCGGWFATAQEVGGREVGSKEVVGQGRRRKEEKGAAALGKRSDTEAS